ncbi:MAG: ion transporter [Opitutaceae bacterium]|jgi:voltage-gated sodium channel|nr:ion transporter [Opitutaceae bacterium]
MSESDLLALRASQPAVSAWRLRLASWVESSRIQGFIVALILLNAAILGLETSPALMAEHGTWLKIADKTCLAIFCVELAIKLVAYRGLFWRSGWNWFDVIVIGFALAPGAGPWSVLRSLRVLRVLRLLTVVPQLRRVVAAFFHSMPGLGGVVAVMLVFFYTSAVLTTKLFGTAFPEWFGTIGKSFYTLFQIMTLESWSMGIVRPVLTQFPYAWAFFVPFIVVATFTILNLFIGIIVSTMQELRDAEAHTPLPDSRAEALLARLETDIAELRKQLRKG